MYARRIKIVTSYTKWRDTMTHNHDWYATDDNYEAGDPLGAGPTEADAVYDLFCQFAEYEDEKERQVFGDEDV